MSEADVVRKFVGDYKHIDEDKIENDDSSKAPYYPKEGVQLRLEMRTLTAVPGGAYAKIIVTKGSWGAKQALEQAVFRVAGDKLVATNMEILGTGLLLTETLSMVEDEATKRIVMQHDLLFSDNKPGKWICEP